MPATGAQGDYQDSESRAWHTFTSRNSMGWALACRQAARCRIADALGSSRLRRQDARCLVPRALRHYSQCTQANHPRHRRKKPVSEHGKPIDRVVRFPNVTAGKTAPRRSADQAQGNLAIKTLTMICSVRTRFRACSHGFQTLPSVLRFGGGDARGRGGRLHLAGRPGFRPRAARPRQADAEADQHRLLARLQPTRLPQVADQDRDRRRDRVAVLLQAPRACARGPATAARGGVRA